MPKQKGTIARGFTLLETLVVIGLIAMIGSFAMFVDFGTYFGSAFRTEERTVLTLLQKARANAMNNVGERPHGLAIYPEGNEGSYVLFAGDSYDPDDSSNQVFEASYEVEIESAPLEIVFEQLSGRSTYSGTVTLKDPNRGISSDIEINYEGAISW